MANQRVSHKKSNKRRKKKESTKSFPTSEGKKAKKNVFREGVVNYRWDDNPFSARYLPLTHSLAVCVCVSIQLLNIIKAALTEKHSCT